MSINDNINNLEKFLKEAFCINKECKFVGFIKTSKSKRAAQFQLNDTKRKTFYITISQEKII